jgi:MerR family transcriptional regulator/heat shock protein HspR
MAPRREAAVYVMSVAADLAGLHPQTLRLYERRGLVEPARSDGGNRRYSDADLDQLRRIVELTDAGVNIEGVRRILELEAKIERLTRALDQARRAVEAVTPKRGLRR